MISTRLLRVLTAGYLGNLLTRVKRYSREKMSVFNVAIAHVAWSLWINVPEDEIKPMKYIFAACAALALFTTDVAARCTGSNLYNTTSASFKASVNKRLDKIPYSEGVYWEISKGGKTSWVIGTIHITDTRVSKPPAFFRKKIQNARVFQMESSPAQSKEVFRLAYKQFLKNKPKPNKVNWWAKLTDAERAVLTKEARIKGFKLDRLKRGTPFTMGGLIRRPKCSESKQKFLDLNLYDVAVKARVPVMGLDRPADVVKNLTKRRTNQAEYFEVLRLELQRLDLRRHYVETMVQMYRAGEAERFLTFESAARKAYTPARYHRATDKFLRDDILAGRNKKWMSAIVSEMNKGNVVTAVGAGHLAGREGILNLLKKRGFQIKRLEL